MQVAHVKLSYSRAFLLRAYPQQTHEMLFDAHNHAFRVLGGVPQRNSQAVVSPKSHGRREIGWGGRISGDVAGVL